MDSLLTNKNNLLDKLRDETPGGYELDVPDNWYEWSDDDLITYISF